MFKRRKIIKELKKLENYPVLRDREFYVHLKSRLEEYMAYNPIRTVSKIHVGGQARLHFAFHRFKYLAPLLIGLLVIFSGGGVAFASQGTLPGDALYPVKILTEDIRSAFTLNSEAQARLQIDYATLRIKELEKILDTKGVDVKSLNVVQKRLQLNLGKATEIVTDLAGINGGEVRDLAQELEDIIDTSQESLKETFDVAKLALENKEELKLLKQTAEDIDKNIEEEKEILVEASGISVFVVEGIELPAELLDEFKDLLSRAQAAFKEGNFEEAQELMKQSEEILSKTYKAKNLLGELGSIEEEFKTLQDIEGDLGTGIEELGIEEQTAGATLETIEGDIDINIEELKLDSNEGAQESTTQVLSDSSSNDINNDTNNLE